MFSSLKKIGGKSLLFKASTIRFENLDRTKQKENQNMELQNQKDLKIDEFQDQITNLSGT